MPTLPTEIYPMRKITIILSTLFALSGCGEESKIKEHIRANLNDPGSAQFKDSIISKNGLTACITWNAKNSMGGYGEWSKAELVMGDSGWQVINMKANPYRCSEEAFTARARLDTVISDAKNEAIALLQKALNLSLPEIATLAETPECRLTISIYAQHAEDVIKNTANGISDNYTNTQYIDFRNKLKSGNCTRFERG